MLLSKWTVCDSKKSKFMKEQEASKLLSSLGRKARLSKTPVVSPLLFYEYKLSEIVNRFLLAGDKFTTERF